MAPTLYCFFIYFQKYLKAKGTFAADGNIQEIIWIPVLLVDFRDGQRVRGYVAAFGPGIHKKKDSHLGGYGHPLPDYTHQLGHSDIHWHQKLLLPNEGETATTRWLLTDYWHSVRKLANDPGTLAQALFKRVLFFKVHFY
jgi:hypothetical protein